MTPVFPTVGAYTAAILVLLGVILTVRVIVGRVKFGVDVGDGENPPLAQAIRAHGNFAEQAPFAILIVVLLEASGAPGVLVIGVAVGLVFARLLSAVGLSRTLGQNPLRQSGAGMTSLFLAVAAIGVLFYA